MRLAEGVEKFSLVAGEDYVVITDRRCEEVVLADGLRQFHRDLRAAEALFVWVACEVCLADEVARKVSGELEDRCIALRHFAMNRDAYSRLEVSVECI